jgi:hypothetical protein
VLGEPTLRPQGDRRKLRAGVTLLSPKRPESRILASPVQGSYRYQPKSRGSEAPAQDWPTLEVGLEDGKQYYGERKTKTPHSHRQWKFQLRIVKNAYTEEPMMLSGEIYYTMASLADVKRDTKVHVKQEDIDDGVSLRDVTPCPQPISPVLSHSIPFGCCFYIDTCRTPIHNVTST